MLKSRDRFLSRNVSRPIVDLDLGLEGSGLVNIPGWRHSDTWEKGYG